ncbi:DUF4956 domain-containing protein [uncultured Vagococcus sp.]|uniref:DUF4956 domain-containing protein n=1 Tax=uncultured Vagococcus sp. TaxID=189676 RepID=UPI0028D175D1|nr:DUF4956 domain-containing protein [uncultured Vagococcus sp.]
MLSSLLANNTENITMVQLLICTLSSIILGVFVASIHMYRNVYSKNFIVTLAILPVLVQSVIMLVNGNLGTGMAVLGAFSLIRFRSVAGGSREITSIFWSMGIGLATGMGYIAYIAVFSVITGGTLIVLQLTNFGKQSKVSNRMIKIVIPEDLDYPNLFDDLWTEYTHEATLDRVKTTNMGSLYELCYSVMLKDQNLEKELLDKIRIRNGNLTVTSAKMATNREEL